MHGSKCISFKLLKLLKLVYYNYFSFFTKNKLNTLSEEMEDSDVLKVVNAKANNRSSTTSFIFSLKNRVGGLARALRVFQVNIYLLITLCVHTLA